MADRITYVGLDVHKESIVVAVAQGGLRGEVREYGRIANTADGVGPFAAQARRRRHDPAVLLRSGTVRLWHSTSIVGPGTRMRRGRPLADPEAGGRPGQDRPAGCRQPGQAAPGGRADGGVGSRCTARGDARSGRAHGSMRCIACAGRASSSPDFCCARDATMAGRPGPSCIAAWLAGLKFEQAVHHIVLEDYIAAVEAAAARRDRLTAQIEAMLPDWTSGSRRGGAADDAGHGAGQCGDADRRTGRSLALRQSAPADGLSRAGAVRTFERRERQTRRHHQGRQRSGAPAVDRGGAGATAFPARLSRELLLRQENQPKPIRDIAWKGQVRLCARYRRLARTGKPATIVTTAIARELAGFVWAIARHVTVTPG